MHDILIHHSMTAIALSLAALAGILRIVPVASQYSLRDHPIQSAYSPLYLDGQWTASEQSLGLNITATVPGDIVTDLQRAGIIKDPWYEITFLDNRTLWDPSVRKWVFTTSVFLPPPGVAPTPLLLVFEGVKMGAHVLWNGAEIGQVTNQFARYIFALPSDSSGGRSTLTLLFDGALITDNRFMPSSGGWDWAPMSQLALTDPVWGTAPVLSSGIWKSVYITSAAPVAVTDVVPLLQYQGVYPVQPLVDGQHAGFQVNVTTHLWVPEGGVQGSLTATGAWGASASSAPLSLSGGEANVTLTLSASASEIQLWWPNGLGLQPLYNISVTWTPSSGSTGTVSATRRIGFRVAALVTVNDTNASIVAQSTGANGSGSFGMFFRINGAALYARGGNVIPSETLEGRLDATAYHTLVQSAADARMNMLRIWGGGVYPADVFYDTCDQLGVLLYHDMMFAGQGHDIAAAKQPFNASTNATLLAEVSHQIRRLAHHPAVVLYDGANEVIVQKSGPTALYASLLMSAVAREDPSRILWPASPAAGWVSGVDRLWGTPNGQPLIPVGTGHIWDAGAERHGPYTAGVGAGNWSTVVRDPWSQAHYFNPGIPLAYLPEPGTAAGPGAPTVFASEFGTMSMSSFEAMTGSLAPSSWSLHGGDAPSSCVPASGGAFSMNCTGRNAMAQRNWPCDNLIWSYFGPVLLNASAGDFTFKGQLFQCSIASAIHMQLDIEQRRAQNQAGTIIWQLQETWSSTGGWGTLEYGGASPGILRGGRWKPTHYWLAGHLFQDVMSACGYIGRSHTFACYVNNGQAQRPYAGMLVLTTISLLDGTESVWGSWNVSVAAGPGSLGWVTPTATLPNASSTLLLASLVDSSGAVSDEHIVHLAAPVSLAVPNATLSSAVASSANPDGSVNITVSSTTVALYVTLTAAAPGRFTDNAFLLRPNTPKTVQWIPFEAGNSTEDVLLLQNSLRVEDMSAYPYGEQ